MKQRNKIPGLPSSVKYQILDFLFIHYIREKIAKQSNSNNKKHTKQASKEKKAQALASFFLTLAACVFAMQSVQRRNLLQNASTARQEEK